MSGKVNTTPSRGVPRTRATNEKKVIEKKGGEKKRGEDNMFNNRALI